MLRVELLPYWALFVELKNSADGAIGYNDISAYSAIYGALSVIEVDMIRALDHLHARTNDG